jgi:putative endonuclease
MHYVYFIWSEKLNKLYIGETSNLKNRIDFHNAGKQRYTSRGVPWKLVGCREFQNRKLALETVQYLSHGPKSTTFCLISSQIRYRYTISPPHLVINQTKR